MKLQISLLFMTTIALSQAANDWKPLKRSPELQIQSANRDSDGIFYAPSDLPISDDDGQQVSFSIGSRLRSLAEGSATAAYSANRQQNVAAKQAAYTVKNVLAKAAAEAVATANAALTGKEVLFDSFRKQVGRAHRSFDSEIAQLELAKKSSSSAEISVQHSKSHVSVLTSALSSAKIVAEMSKMSVDDAVVEMSAQSAMIAETKAKLKELEDQLHAAEIDYVSTKESAEKATRTAQIAQKDVILAGHKFTDMIHNMMATADDNEKVDPLQYLTDQQKKREVPKEE